MTESTETNQSAVNNAQPGGERSQPLGKPSKILVIINPAAGQEQPILKTLNTTLQEAGVEWDIAITKEAGDARRLAQEAVLAGVSLVGVHGGDGTVMEVASGLAGSDVPLAILPGGTANVMSLELGVPADLAAACNLLVDPNARTRWVDMGQVGEHNFMLRAGMGFEQAMVEGADRELKDRLGVLAYALSGLQALADPVLAHYRLTIDGQVIETEGMTCIIANSGNVGLSGIALAPNIDISDGLLDVLVVTKANLPALVSLVASVVRGAETPPAMQQWQARSIKVESDPVQKVQVDGEILAETPVEAHVLPRAVRIVVPPS